MKQRHLLVICSDGVPAVDIHAPDDQIAAITNWFIAKGPDEVLSVQADNCTVFLQKRHVVRMEVYP